MKSSAGSELQAPRDRAGTFEPQIVKKHQTQLTDELERKVIALFALGNSSQRERRARPTGRQWPSRQPVTMSTGCSGVS